MANGLCGFDSYALRAEILEEEKSLRQKSRPDPDICSKRRGSLKISTTEYTNYTDFACPKETSGHFCVDHWADTTDALAN